MNVNQVVVRKALLGLLDRNDMDPIQLGYEFMARAYEGSLPEEVNVAYISLTVDEIKQIMRELMVVA